VSQNGEDTQGSREGNGTRLSANYKTCTNEGPAVCDKFDGGPLVRNCARHAGREVCQVGCTLAGRSGPGCVLQAGGLR
jgi:hypothetical protein